MIFEVGLVLEAHGAQVAADVVGVDHSDVVLQRGQVAEVGRAVRTFALPGKTNLQRKS